MDTLDKKLKFWVKGREPIVFEKSTYVNHDQLELFFKTMLPKHAPGLQISPKRSLQDAFALLNADLATSYMVYFAPRIPAKKLINSLKS